MSILIHADFTCPSSLLASLRTDRLIGIPGHSIDWRAVGHRPRLPQTGLRLNPQAVSTRTAALDRVRELAVAGEDLPEVAPDFLPHPDAPVAAYAEAYGAGVADEVRQLLFNAYWVHGQDIGNPEVLRPLLHPVLVNAPVTCDPVHRFGYAVSPQRAPLSNEAYHRMRDWQRDWLGLGGEVGLTLTDLTRTDQERTFTGPAALAALDGRAPIPSQPAAA